jgi:hypothetical protein
MIPVKARQRLQRFQGILHENMPIACGIIRLVNNCVLSALIQSVLRKFIGVEPVAPQRKKEGALPNVTGIGRNLS